MKRIISILVAFALFLVTVGYISHHQSDLTDVQLEIMRYDLSPAKQDNVELLAQLLDENSVLTMGSSELSTIGESTHPVQFYKDGQHDFDLVLLGQGYTQCLNQAISLAALAPYMDNKQVVLILSAQWFTEEHIDPGAFASVFRMNMYREMLRNPELSDDLKVQMVNRCHEILGEDDLAERLSIQEELYLSDSANILERTTETIRAPFFKFQRGYQARKRAKDVESDFDWEQYLLERPFDLAGQSATAISFEKRLEVAEAEGRASVTNNDFGIEDHYYNEYMKDTYDNRKDSEVDSRFTVSKEYEDLNLFLDVCAELNIEPMLVSVPVNGYWYDYTGFPIEEREGYYNNIVDICKQRSVQLLDLSAYEYTDYVLRDIMHLGWKGWVFIGYEIERFYRQN
ncbi:MAG TPA: D-alanyl-lipoteichoic acid biosynthesis protein DltD [Clostridiaceae bacterium]|nr:D-alanyl-lipoteichoic acid biosynthesis protein DltD [Clostridiaceae bacterium]